jgi:hypothetical protein
VKRALLLLLLLPLAGCSLAPPVPLEQSEDPNVVKLGKELKTGWDPPQLAVAPIKTTYLDRFVSVPRAWTDPPLPQSGRALQARLQQVLRWGLHDPVPSPTHADWPLFLEKVNKEERDPRRAMCRAAEDAGAQLVAQLEITSLRAAFVERKLPWWPVNAFLFWGIGIFPVVFIPDEEYKVAVKANVVVLDARTGEALVDLRDYHKEYSASFNDFQRGWSAESVFFLHEAFLVAGYEDFIGPFRNLWPHLRERLLAEALDDLRQQLPDAVEASREVLEKGDPERPRTYALLIASKNPPLLPGVPKEDRPHALAADDDARELRRYLRESDSVHPQDLFNVVDTKSARAEIREALDTIGRRSRQHDRVIIYYSGYGTADAAGDPQLVLDDGLLPLRRLREWCQEKLHRNPHVALLLDTSFGSQRKERGRNYPGGGDPKPGFLSTLGADPDRWTILAAARGGQIASSSPADGGRGIFSLYLLSGLRGAAAGPRGSAVNADTLYRYVSRGVRDYARLSFPSEDRPQTPVIWPPEADAILQGSTQAKKSK